MNEPRQFCTFHLGEFLFGVDVKEVQEVLSSMEKTRVPLAPNVIGGLINLRGQIVTAIDLRQRLGLPPCPDHILPMNVVIRTHTDAVSLLVDSIGTVLSVDETSFEPPPETLMDPARDLILGTYKLKNSLLLVLDIGKVVNVVER
jgi:purine-binding chemotaxis protein CheW